MLTGNLEVIEAVIMFLSLASPCRLDCNPDLLVIIMSITAAHQIVKEAVYEPAQRKLSLPRGWRCASLVLSRSRADR